MDAEALLKAIEAQGTKIREAKAAGATKEAVTAEVVILNNLKAEYKGLTGSDPPQASAPATASKAPSAAKEAKKEKETKIEDKIDKKISKGSSVAAPPPPSAPLLPAGPMFVPSASILDNLKIVLAAKALRCALPPVAPDDLDTVFAIPAAPAIVDVGTGLLVFTTDVVCQYLALGSQLGNISEADTAAFDTFMRIEEVYLTTFLQSMISSASVGSGEYEAICEAKALTNRVIGYSADEPITTRPSLQLDWDSAGLISSLTAIFDEAIRHAFPFGAELCFSEAIMARCGNAAFGDFQCNNAMGIAKTLKGLKKYKGPLSPKDIAERIMAAIPSNPLVESTTAAPNGFINIKLSTSTMVNSIATLTQRGVIPPTMKKLNVLVDFSSPNIAKEMHVGHLRSTIIGDSICRVLEFCGHEVSRVNHVGDWGTQFGMLIAYLQWKYPNILSDVPDISNLTEIYRRSKEEFDKDLVLDMYSPQSFKEVSRQNVVKLQGGDPTCRQIWNLLCDVSRKEFQKVYDLLGVTLNEFGESFYNPMIPGVINELTQSGLVIDEEGMLVIKLPHFTIPLIVRKSDGGYGYDSTDMAAISYRLRSLNMDWLIYITDAGQKPHFQMCFDVAKEAGWITHQRVEHIGFGVVCGEDGGKFKTRSGTTVRLVDLLDEAKDRMKQSLAARLEEGKCVLQGEDEIEHASKCLGYGAVKYCDLKQNPVTSYIFSYDRMLDTKGDTAIYLIFAYARMASILRKAKEERMIDITSISAEAQETIVLEHPCERALAFELLQLGDVIKFVLSHLNASKICAYLSEVSVKFTDFVTQCHVLNATDVTSGEVDRERRVRSRLLLCEATRRVMEKCFSLLGIDPLDRI